MTCFTVIHRPAVSLIAKYPLSDRTRPRPNDGWKDLRRVADSRELEGVQSESGAWVPIGEFWEASKSCVFLLISHGAICLKTPQFSPPLLTLFDRLLISRVPTCSISKVPQNIPCMSPHLSVHPPVPVSCREEGCRCMPNAAVISPPSSSLSISGDSIVGPLHCDRTRKGRGIARPPLPHGLTPLLPFCLYLSVSRRSLFCPSHCLVLSSPLFGCFCVLCGVRLACALDVLCDCFVI